jgi:hypothetical protein
MDLESITLYLAMKHLEALEIHAESNSGLGQGTVGYSTITRCLRKRSFPHSSESAEEEPGIRSCDPIDRAILQALNQQPFSSLRQLAKRTLIPAISIRYRLVDRMGYKIKHCKCVLHRLSAARKQTRVTVSRNLLDLLHSLQHQGWKYVGTLDEAWFCFSNQHKQIWLPEDEDPPRNARPMISSPKPMLTVVWNPHRFYVIKDLPR